MFRICLFVLFALFVSVSRAGEIQIATASDLRYALDELIALYQAEHTNDHVTAVFGSSGKFATQIENGAPFDVFMSADISYPRQLEEKKLTASSPRTYAFGRIVVWSLAKKIEVSDLADPTFKKIAIANPAHAPYGLRAKEALEASGIWSNIESRLVMGDNISQTAQFVESGGADAGIVALSLVISPNLRDKGFWTLIDEKLHSPLEQGLVILKRAADNELAFRFVDFMSSTGAVKVLQTYGFVIPGAITP